MKNEKKGYGKRIFGSAAAIMFLLVSLLSMLSPAAAAATTIEVGDVTGILPGESVTIPIMILNVTNVGVAAVNFSYDPSVVHVTAVTDSQFEIFSPTINNETGEFEIAGLQFDEDGLNGDVRLANVTLKAVGIAGQSSPLNITINELKDATGATQNIPADVNNGTFTIGGEAPLKVVINEFSSYNSTGDWIELYNKEASQILLNGWSINDSTGEIHTFGTGANISAYGYLVVDVSNRLNQAGDTITLLNGTEIADTVTYGAGAGEAPAPGEGKSTGRYPNGIDTGDDAADFREFEVPTPGASNVIPSPSPGPTTTANATELPDEPSPIPSGYELNWTDEDVVISFRRVDNGGSDVDYTNVSTNLSESWTKVNATTVVGPDASIISAITADTFNVTVSDEDTTTIWYYSVDKNVTPNIETTKNLTVRIDKTAPGNITDLNDTATGPSWIQWNWTNPTPGFDHVEVWLDGEQKEDVTGESYKAELLTHDTTYNISVRAVDGADNKGNWANDTAKTEIVIPQPFVIDGYVSYANGTVCNGSRVNITNVDTARDWTAQTSASTNYYKLNITSWTDVNVSETLRINAQSPDGVETNTTTHMVTQEDVNNGGLPNFNIRLSPAVGKPDLIVSEITPNCGYIFGNESNNISATIKNNGTGAADAFNVSFVVVGGVTEKVRVDDGLAAGANKTISFIDTTTRNAGESVTINVTADCDGNVTESNETNNALNVTETVVNNGYKGKTYTGGKNITTIDNGTIELNGNMTFSFGDSYYMSAKLNPNWKTYNASWTASNLTVPANATVVAARLHVPYTWDKADVMPNNVSLTFNGIEQDLEAHYTDRKGYGSPDYDRPYGLLVYNVSADFSTSGNIANLSNLHTGGGNVSIRGMGLGLVYLDANEPLRTMIYNEGFDLLYGGSSKCTTPEEATAYAPFTLDTTRVVKTATLVTFAPGAGNISEGDLIFNDKVIGTDVWQFAGATQIGMNISNVTDYIGTTNVAGFRSNSDYMEASCAVLMVEYGEQMKKCGDVNCDGEINIGDVTLLLNHWGNPETYPLCDDWAGDVNCDGEINIGDVTLLLNHWGNPETYPLNCCQ